MATPLNPQDRADRLRIFREELDALERDQVLTLSEQQRAGVDAYVDRTLAELAIRNDVDITESQRQLSLGLKIASALGGLALCAAVALFLNRFMGLWPTPVQVAVLIALPILLIFGAEFAARREKTLYYASLLSLVAFAAFVANLAALGSIFNIVPTPNAMLAWGAFGLALGYHFGVRLILAGGLVSLLGWATASFNHWRGFWWSEWDHQPEQVMLGGLLMVAAPRLIRHVRWPEFPPIYRLVGLLAVFFTIMILSFGGGRSMLPWDAKSIERFYQIGGLLASGVAIWLGVRQVLPEVLNTGVTFFVLFLFLRLYDWLWDWMPAYLFFLVIGGIAIGLVALFKKLRKGMRAAVAV